jgi:hypothetical protein
VIVIVALNWEGHRDDITTAARNYKGKDIELKKEGRLLDDLGFSPLPQQINCNLC